MDECISLLLCELQSLFACLVINVPIQNDLCTEIFSTVNFYERSRGGHNDDCFKSVLLCGICDTLRMVSRGSRDYTPIPVLLRHGADFVVSATKFVSARHLHVLRLQVYLVSCSLA